MKADRILENYGIDNLGSGILYKRPVSQEKQDKAKKALSKITQSMSHVSLLVGSINGDLEKAKYKDLPNKIRELKRAIKDL